MSEKKRSGKSALEAMLFAIASSASSYWVVPSGMSVTTLPLGKRTSMIYGFALDGEPVANDPKLYTPPAAPEVGMYVLLS